MNTTTKPGAEIAYLGPSGPFVDGAWYAAAMIADDGGDFGDGWNLHGIVQFDAEANLFFDESGSEYSRHSADAWVMQGGAA